MVLFPSPAPQPRSLASRSFESRLLQLPSADAPAAATPRSAGAGAGGRIRVCCPSAFTRYSFVYFGDCALVNTIFGIEHLLYCNPSRCILQSTLRSIWFPPAPPPLFRHST